MEFKSSEIPSFLSHFQEVKQHIRNFPGCQFLELYRDKNDSTIFFTYSRWETEAHLDAYRHSELFGKVWRATKEKFQKKAQAWSVDTLHRLD
jgi:heme-degrading monooxygenase HmoA